MTFGSVALFVVVHLILVWMATRMKKSKYKILAFFLIALSIFGYVSFNLAFEGHDINLSDFKGVTEASGIYFSWLGSVFGNAHAITTMAIENNSRDDGMR